MGVLGVLGIVAIVVVGLIGAGIVWGVGNAAGWGKANSRKALKGSQKKSLPAYSLLDADGNLSQKDVLKVVSPYADDEALGTYAQSIIEVFNKADVRRKGIYSLMEQEFSKESLTWDKFSGPVDGGFDAIVRNAAQIANRMQAFDSAEYLRMDRIEKAGGYDSQSNEVSRLEVMRATLKEMDELQARNEELIGELERLQAELTKLTGSSVDNNEVLEEIQRLSEDAKFYA